MALSACASQARSGRAPRQSHHSRSSNPYWRLLLLGNLRKVVAESIARSQTALCGSTGSLKMPVFQMLSAGNSGQFGAPGTTVPLLG
jgi:hypothetical protein